MEKQGISGNRVPWVCRFLTMSPTVGYRSGRIADRRPAGAGKIDVHRQFLFVTLLHYYIKEQIRLASKDEPHITLTGLAKFMMATSSQQRSILHKYRFDEPESAAVRKYYREAYNTLHRYYRGSYQVSWLHNEADTLESEATPLNQQMELRIENNADTIRKFAQCFDRSITNPEAPPVLTYSHTNLSVKVTTDIFGKEKGHHRLIKFHFAKPYNDQPDRFAKIVCQVMYEAANAAGLALPSSAIRLWGSTYV